MSILATIQVIHNEREENAKKAEEITQHIQKAKKLYQNKQTEMAHLRQELEILRQKYAQNVSESPSLYNYKQQQNQDHVNHLNNINSLYRKTLSDSLNAAQHRLDCVQFPHINSIQLIEKRWEQQNLDQIEASNHKEKIKEKLQKQLEDQRKENKKMEEMLKQHRNQYNQILNTNKSKKDILHQLQIQQKEVLIPKENDVNFMKSAIAKLKKQERRLRNTNDNLQQTVDIYDSNYNQ